MLLYDQLIEHIYRMKILAPNSSHSERDVSIANSLMSVPVYELTDCLALQSDWEREKNRPIPKRSPAPFVWTEWKSLEVDSPHLGGGSTWFTNGFLIGEHPPGFIASECNSDQISQINRVLMQAGAKAGLEDYQQGGCFYTCLSFKRTDKQVDTQGKLIHKAAQGVIIADLYPYAFITKQDGSGSVVYCLADEKLEAWWGQSDESCEQKLKAIGSFFPRTLGLTTFPFVKVASQGVDSWCFPWVPFMAFALLHCKNIVTVDHPPESRVVKHCNKQGLPLRVTYKTLHMHLPKNINSGREYHSQTGDGPKVRQHICSGHFRELRSDRFTNKQGEFVWVPQHVRGSEGLGVVKSTRVLHKRSETD